MLQLYCWLKIQQKKKTWHSCTDKFFSIFSRAELNLSWGHSAHVAFALCNQHPQVRFLAIPQFIEQHCLVRGQLRSNQPILYRAGVCKSSWVIRQSYYYQNLYLSFKFKITNKEALQGADDARFLVNLLERITASKVGMIHSRSFFSDQVRVRLKEVSG